MSVSNRNRLNKVFFVSILFFLIACRSSGPVNKTREQRVKPSDAINRENKRVIKKGIKADKREMRKRRRAMRKTGHYS
ncbi:MAG: hypothetical protein HYU69_05360 [Bacteroidetes bacterium]|nr:hypothetical protein [Bacteroidota bacterium]